jgi:beta-phosphoglucomutase-like phosphatase (HAD superfamily)
MTATATLLLGGAGVVLLDFDGPTCSVFAGMPAAGVAAELLDIIRQAGHALPEEAVNERDPLAVLRLAAEVDDPAVLGRVEDALRVAELAAVRSAMPTPGADELMRHVGEMRRPLVMVSNNSEPAIAAYLALHDLTELVTAIVGRHYGRPELMKPDPWSLEQAATIVGVPVTDAVLIGDSDTDVQAAHLVNAMCIGYANRSDKAETLTRAGADAIVTTIHALLDE